MSELSILDPAHPNLVAHASMSGISGSQLTFDTGGITAALSNASQVTDIVSKALQVNSGGFADLGDILDDLFTGADKTFSIGLFVKGTSLNALFSKLGDTTHGEDARQFTLRVVNGYVGFLYYASLSSSHYREVRATEAPINNDVAHHVGISYNGALDTNNGLDRVEIRIDGSPVAKTLALTNGSLGNIQPGPARIGIGASLGSAGVPKYTSSAVFDELRIYDTLLTDDDWRTLAGAIYPYHISGTLSVDGAPLSTQIRLYSAATGELLDTAASDATGGYQIVLPTADPVYAMAIEPNGYRPLVHGPISPALRNS